MGTEYAFEQLAEGLSICVSAVHKFGTDAFLLSAFAAPRKADAACDLGTGCGIVPLLWLRPSVAEHAPRRIDAVDVQEGAIRQLRTTLEQPACAGRITPVLADLNVLSGVLPAGAYTLVTCNPPYKAAGTGIPSQQREAYIARHEALCSIGEVCAAAARLLRFGGRFCVCQRPERLLDTLAAMRQSGVEPKRVRFVQQREGGAPWLFLAEGRRGGKPHLAVEPPLIIEGGGRNGFSAELLAIYGENKT